MEVYFVLNDSGEPVPVNDINEWTQWCERADRSVARTVVAPDVMVLTIFNGIDEHAENGEGRSPLLFGTRVFGGRARRRRAAAAHTRRSPGRATNTWSSGAASAIHPASGWPRTRLNNLYFCYFCELRGSSTRVSTWPCCVRTRCLYALRSRAWRRYHSPIIDFRSRASRA
jgi:hypothetical protein